ncbi:MAG: hypothetical protein ACREBW_01000 [Candidatus Micrarchaeaceae archaeon]
MDAKVIDRFRREWPKPIPQNGQVVEFLTKTYRRYCDEELADREYSKQLASGSPCVYQQRVAELLLAEALWSDGFSLTSEDEGPDFLAKKGGETTWIELVTPEPTGIPEEFLHATGDGVWTLPHEQILLRWTAAIAEKARKLLGDPASGARGYVENRVVKPADRYVIAVNDRLLVRWPDGMTGISQFPFPVEALFAVGPYAVTINRKTLKTVSAGHQKRLFVMNHNQAKVQANTFLDPEYASVSAVLGITLREDVVLGRPHTNALVYNPLATNPLPHKLLTSQEHWVCDVGPEEYTVHRLDDEPVRGDWITQASEG